MVDHAASAYAAPKETEPEEKAVRFARPEHVRGIYLTAWSAGLPKKFESFMAMIDRTELNAVVIDVRDDGDQYWKNGIKLSAEAGANNIAVVNPQRVFDSLAKHKVYPIARIACFRDEKVPAKFPERAVQLASGRPWQDRSGHTWLDPYNKKNWEYLSEVVDHALDLGFAEIQLDYVRFPSEGKASTQVYPGKKTYDPNAKPEDVISAFAHFIGEKVKARGAVYSADIFGIISSNRGDEGIGQMLEKVAEPFDLICPMVYPSHYAKGEYGIADPNRSPYAILIKSLGDYRKRLPNKPLRPWLQDFSLGYAYGVKEVQAQIKAAKELGYEEYLLWNAGNRYTEAAVKDNSRLVKTGQGPAKTAPAGPSAP